MFWKYRRIFVLSDAGGEIAHSVYGLLAGRPRFDSRQGQEIFLFSRPALGVHPASYLTVIGSSFAMGKATGARS
jgi:hypothetical protein